MACLACALAYGPCFSALLELALRYIGCYYSRLEETYMLAWLFPCNTKRVTQLVWFWFCSDSCACEDTINARVYKWMKGASGKRAVPILFVWERLAGSLFQAPSAQRIDFLEPTHRPLVTLPILYNVVCNIFFARWINKGYQAYTPNDWMRITWSDEYTVERGVGIKPIWTFVRPRDQVQENDVQPIHGRYCDLPAEPS